MALEVIYGETRNRSVAQALARELQKIADDGTVYIGYPVLASADDRVFVDALAVLPLHGLVAFQLADLVPQSADQWDAVVTAQDRLYGALQSYLGRHPELLDRRRLAFPIETITVFPDAVGAPPADTEGHYCDLQHVPNIVSKFEGIDDVRLKALRAALQRVSTIKPAKRRQGVSKQDSRGAVLKRIEKEIANLDRWQKRAAIEMPEGPQRIRGLAGSGKTIVLALKAAYLHAQHPDWDIAVTFHTRALYQQFEDLVTRFSFEHSYDAPDFERLQILHAWGSRNRDGIYAAVARSLGHPVRDWNYARSAYGSDEAFEGVCSELLAATNDDVTEPLWDAVLIDEAQDLPPAFFQLVHRFARDPKRVVWAYDELQKLSEAAMPSTEQLFGSDASGDPHVVLVNQDGQAKQDIILEVCYRNTPWALATAHAIGFGVYREDGLVQHFDDPTLWSDIGYQVLNGSLAPGKNVTLARSESSYPSFFPDLLDAEDSVVLALFDTEAAHDEWVANAILRNLAEDELEHDDILVVVPDAYTAKRRASRLRRVLARHSIASHLVGVSSSVDEVFVRDSIAIAHIYRAKGNEAPMVYVLDGQYAVRDINAVTRRNTLFTAITRSKAWVRISAWGDRAHDLESEVRRVFDRRYRLAFNIPTPEELAQMRRIHRDRSEAEVESLRRATKGLQDVVEAFERDEVDLADLDPALRTRLLNLIREDLENGRDSGSRQV